GIPWKRLIITRESYRRTRLEQYKNFESIPLSSDDVRKLKGDNYYEFFHNTIQACNSSFSGHQRCIFAPSIFVNRYIGGAEIGRFVVMLSNPSSELKAYAEFSPLQVTFSGGRLGVHHCVVTLLPWPCGNDDAIAFDTVAFVCLQFYDDDWLLDRGGPRDDDLCQLLYLWKCSLPKPVSWRGDHIVAAMTCFGYRFHCG
nr:hypothetical protein [Tanacetum cinerariifolium]